MRSLIILVTVAMAAGCLFDTSALGLGPCTTNADCSPDAECQDGRCLRRACTTAADCGVAQEFACRDGQCTAVTCTDGCGPGFQCGLEGYCWPESCVPSHEGPPGDPTCTDGADNDCDSRIDAEDPGCQPCTKDADCDDGKPCNGVETCGTEGCLDGTPISCPQPTGACQESFCDDLAPVTDPCVVLLKDDGADCDDGDLCTENDACSSGLCVGEAKTCNDGVGCTEDACDPATGVCVFAADDGQCATGELCRPACFAGASGCGVPPASLTLSCESPVSAGTDGSCTVDLAGVGGQEACLECRALGGAVDLFYADFSDDQTGTCSLDGWALAAGSPCTTGWCPILATGPLQGSRALQADRAVCDSRQYDLERTIGTAGWSRVYVCFDYADDGASGGNDFVGLSYVLGGQVVALFSDVDGPLPDVDNQWLRYCVLLPTETIGQAGVGLRLSLHSNDDNQRVYVDRVVALGYRDACTSRTVVFNSTFDSCDLTGWSLSGTISCPGFKLNSLEANNSNKSWTIERTVDTRGLDGELVLHFDLAEQGTANGDSFTVEINTGASWQPAFVQNGLLRADSAYTTFMVNLSEFDPTAEGNASLGIRLTASSSAANHQLDLDNVRLEAVQLTCPTGVTLGPVTEQAAGVYGMSTSAASAARAQISCSWDSPPEPVTDLTTVEFTP